MEKVPFRAVLSMIQPADSGVSGNRRLLVNSRAKPFGGAVGYVLANEFICSGIGVRLGLPIPPHAPVMLGDEGDVYFASLDFGLGGGPYPLMEPQRCVKMFPDISTGLLLFDIWITNPDRHRGNLSVDFESDDRGVVVFDQGHALFGHNPGAGSTRLRQFDGRLGCTGGAVTGQNRHVLIDHIVDDHHFEKWLQRIEQFPDYMIDDLCHPDFSLGISKAEADEAGKFLKERRDSIRRIVDVNRKEFKSIIGWSLIGPDLAGIDVEKAVPGRGTVVHRKVHGQP